MDLGCSVLQWVSMLWHCYMSVCSDGPVGDPGRQRPLASGGGALLGGGGDRGGHPELGQVRPQPLRSGKGTLTASAHRALCGKLKYLRSSFPGDEAMGGTAALFSTVIVTEMQPHGVISQFFGRRPCSPSWMAGLPLNHWNLEEKRKRHKTYFHSPFAEEVAIGMIHIDKMQKHSCSCRALCYDTHTHTQLRCILIKEAMWNLCCAGN